MKIVIDKKGYSEDVHIYDDNGNEIRGVQSISLSVDIHSLTQLTMTMIPVKELTIEVDDKLVTVRDAAALIEE